MPRSKRIYVSGPCDRGKELEDFPSKPPETVVLARKKKPGLSTGLCYIHNPYGSSFLQAYSALILVKSDENSPGVCGALAVPSSTN
jgi:hypothetical protein